MQYQIIVETLQKSKNATTIITDFSKTKVTFFESTVYNILVDEGNGETVRKQVKEIFFDDCNNHYYHVAGEENISNFYNFQHNIWRNYRYLIDVEFLKGQTDNLGDTLSSIISDFYIYNTKSYGLTNKLKVFSIRRFYIDVEDEDFDLKDIKKLIEELNLQFQINPVIHSLGITSLNPKSISQIPTTDKVEDIELLTKKTLCKKKIKDANGELIPLKKRCREYYNIHSATDEYLLEFNSKLQLGLSLGDLRAIKSFFEKKDNYIISKIELETIAQTWSEHCKHRIFSAEIDDISEGLYATYIQGATNKIMKEQREESGKDFCYSVFKDNAGAIEFNDQYLITHKVETHNSPTSLDPFGGAITGILGVNRDCLGFGLGARPFMNTYAFCFPNPSNEVFYSRKQDMKDPQLSSNYIIQGVIKGIESGGNCSGIPTVHGVVYFDDSFIAKPLVFAGTIGLIPKEINGRDSCKKKPLDGDLIVILGGRTGRDGIHGAIFSSDSLDENSNITHVQIGDPITQKKMLDAILEARDLGLYNSITDNGAGGFSSSIGEMGFNGFEVDLRKVLLKAENIEPEEIWISESQERMTLAVSERHKNKLIEIVEKHSVEYQIIGKFNSSGIGKIIFNDENDKEIFVDINLDFLHNGTPKYKLISKESSYRDLTEDEKNSILENGLCAQFIKSQDAKRCLESYIVNSESEKNTLKRDLKEDIISILSRKNISTREDIVTQYDHTVQGGSIVQPIQGAGNICVDAAVSKPILDEKSGVAVSSSMNPRFGGQDEDTYNMSLYAIDASIRNLICVGANIRKIALLDNFCWSDSFNPKRLWQLKRAAQGCYDGAVAFKTPFISGKDSMFNDFKGYDKNNNAARLSNLPTVLISSIGIVDDASYCVTSDFKNETDLIYILGYTKPELGGSEYFDMIKYNGGFVPIVNVEESIQNYKIFDILMQKRFIESSISVHVGGLITSINKSAIGGMKGVFIDIKNDYLGDCKSIEQFLFSESSSRIIFSVRKDNQLKVEEILKESKAYFNLLGEVVQKNDNVALNFNDRRIFYDFESLCNSYYSKLY
jgi:phosphoribosylformylglycinamidine synthase